MASTAMALDGLRVIRTLLPTLFFPTCYRKQKNIFFKTWPYNWGVCLKVNACMYGHAEWISQNSSGYNVAYYCC